MSELYNNRNFPKSNSTRNTTNFRFTPSTDKYTFYYRRIKSGENPKVGDRIFLHSGASYWVTSVSRRPPGIHKGSKNCGSVTVRKCTN
jgi:hypothetical protein